MPDLTTFPAGRSPAAYRKWLVVRVVVIVALLVAAGGAALGMLVVEDAGVGRRDPHTRLLALVILLGIAGVTVLASTSQAIWRRTNGQEVRGPTRRGLTVDRSGFRDMTSRRRGLVPWHHVARWWIDHDELRVELRFGKPPRVIRLSGLRAARGDVATAFEKYSGLPPSR